MTESKPRFVVEGNLAEERLQIRAGRIPVHDVLEAIYLGTGCTLQEAEEDRFVLQRAVQL